MPPTTPPDRIDWRHVLELAGGIVAGYDTPVTLRQLFYRLVAAQALHNTTGAYKRLSAVTAEARRAGTFPPLMDRGRGIRVPASWGSPRDALDALGDHYRRDRTEAQPYTVVVAVEKAGLVALLTTWFGPLGVPVVALGGYASQSLVDEVAAYVADRDRPAVLVYGGDFDPTGEDVDRDFVDRSACWANVERVALTAEQVDAYGLPPAPGKVTDSRAGAFVARHGRLVQVELDALAPDDLRRLYAEGIAPWWDDTAHRDALAVESVERGRLLALAGTVEAPA